MSRRAPARPRSIIPQGARVWPLLLTALFAAGCAGYHVGPVAQRNFRTIAVPMFRNRTLRPQLEAQITNAIIKGLQQDGSLRIEPEANADVVLDGKIVDYRRTALRSQRSDTEVPREYGIAITVLVEARDRRTGEIVLKPTELTGRSDVFIGADQQSAEEQVLPLIADDIGHKVVGLLVESWP
ncbi:MAG TPA: LptE family protein [Verrucomicrobiae bacterium]|nr:LptE family protein [Verrucomicrobiae bacterium]